jgi:hypothetical protein
MKWDYIRKAQDYQLRLKLNETYHLLVYIADANLLRDNKNFTNKNTESLIGNNMEVGKLQKN